MNKNTKLIRLYSALLLLFSAAAVTLRAVACLNDLEYSIGLFSSYTMVRASGIVAAIGALLLFTYVFLADRISAVPSFSEPSTYVPSGLTAISLIFLCASLLTDKNTETDAPRTVIIICAVMALLSVVHFFLNAFLTEAHNELRAYFSLATVAFTAIYVSYLYFESSLPVNAPGKITDEIAYLFSSLFFLYEARISLGRERWRAYTAFGLVAALLNAYSAIPALIVYFVNGRVISNSIQETLLTFALFIFITARIVMVSRLKESTENRAIISMKAFARRREEIIAESMNVHKEAFAVQMTIDDLLPKPKAQKEDIIPEDLPVPDPETVEDAPMQITLEMLLPTIDKNSAEANE